MKAKEEFFNKIPRTKEGLEEDGSYEAEKPKIPKR